MTATLAPLNSADVTFGYSTDNTTYTSLSKVTMVEPSGRVRKELQRLLLGGTSVAKIVVRLNDGDLKWTAEFEDATFSIFNTIFAAKTRYYFRMQFPDTGGTASSKAVFDGYIREMPIPVANGDDEVLKYTITQSVNTMTYTAGS